VSHRDGNYEDWLTRADALAYRCPFDKWVSEKHVKTKLEEGVAFYSMNDIDRCSVQLNIHQLKPNEIDALRQEYEV